MTDTPNFVHYIRFDVEYCRKCMWLYMPTGMIVRCGHPAAIPIRSDIFPTSTWIATAHGKQPFIETSPDNRGYTCLAFVPETKEPTDA